MALLPNKLSGLQALLLLGGAFVFVGFLIVRSYTLVLDTSPTAPPQSEIVLSIVKRDETFLKSAAWAKFLAALPKEAAQALSQAQADHTATLFAVRGEDGALAWGLVEALSTSRGQSQKPQRKLVPREVGAVGSFRVAGQTQPIQAYFEPELVRFEIGRGYRGLLANPVPFTMGRRLIQPINQQIAHLEKPSEASWGKAPALFQSTMQRFKGLADPWTWPGRVELAVSASSTGETLYPFLLFYKPTVGQKNVAKQTEDFARNLLAQAAPQTVLVNLPDDSQMTEFRHDPESIQKEEIRNQFGTLLRLTAPGKSQRMLVFLADDHEVWISNDLALIQAGFLDNVQATTPSSACDRDSIGGFASLSGQSFSYGSFSRVNISINDIETGLFTLCGYY
ncbi:MAG: hypothetical protein WC866_04910 [Patescibacteria group bacterium]|jgi:hypothetical protein